MKRKNLSRRVIAAVWKQWWFLPLVVLPQFIPPYSSQGYNLTDWGMVNAYILTHPIQAYFRDIFPVFQIAPLVLLAALFFTGQKIIRVFSGYVALSYGVMAVLQNTSVSEQYGFAICTANVITFIMLAGLWFWEAAFPKNKLETAIQPVWKYWVVVLALISFWRPFNPLTLTLDFNPFYLFTSGTGLSFCMTTPLYLAVLILCYPHVNQPVFVATSLVGVMIGLGNMVLEFVIYPALWLIGLFHLPLLIISSLCMWISLGEVAGRVRKVMIVNNSV